MRKERTELFDTQLEFMKTHPGKINFVGMQGIKFDNEYFIRRFILQISILQSALKWVFTKVGQINGRFGKLVNMGSTYSRLRQIKHAGYSSND